MTQKQITHLQDMIDDFFSETQTEAIIDNAFRARRIKYVYK